MAKSDSKRPSNIPELISGELERRIREMPLSELLALYAGAPVPSLNTTAAAPSLHRVRLKDAISRVMSEADRALDTAEIVARVLALRPGTPEPSIRSDLSRGKSSGYLKVTPDGKWMLGRSSMRIRRAG